MSGPLEPTIQRRLRTPHYEREREREHGLELEHEREHFDKARPLLLDTPALVALPYSNHGSLLDFQSHHISYRSPLHDRYNAHAQDYCHPATPQQLRRLPTAYMQNWPEHTLVPHVEYFAPQSGSAGLDIRIELAVSRFLLDHPSVKATVFFSNKPVQAMLERLGEPAFHPPRFAVSAYVPQLEFIHTRENVPITLHLGDAAGASIAFLSVGDFTYLNEAVLLDLQDEILAADTLPSTYGTSRKRKSPNADEGYADAKRRRQSQRPSQAEYLPSHRHLFAPTTVGQQQHLPVSLQNLESLYRSPHTPSYMTAGYYETPQYEASVYQQRIAASVRPSLRKTKSSGAGLSTSSSFRRSDLGKQSRSPSAQSDPTAVARPGASTADDDTAIDAPDPPLIRTSTLPTGSEPGSSVNQHTQGWNTYSLSPVRASLRIDGDLEDMARRWTRAETETQRRLVEFQRSQAGSIITTTFKAVEPDQRTPNSICISCIWCESKQEAYVTSVDTIYLLESLVAVRFTVEEKNRIRRNLEGFHPLTVSKSRPDSEDFFKLVMGFSNPRPRNIEKDIKVFPWSILARALKKIIGKYSASYPANVGALQPPKIRASFSMSSINVSDSESRSVLGQRVGTPSSRTSSFTNNQAIESVVGASHVSPAMVAAAIPDFQHVPPFPSSHSPDINFAIPTYNMQAMPQQIEPQPPSQQQQQQHQQSTSAWFRPRLPNETHSFPASRDISSYVEMSPRTGAMRSGLDEAYPMQGHTLQRVESSAIVVNAGSSSSPPPLPPPPPQHSSSVPHPQWQQRR